MAQTIAGLLVKLGIDQKDFEKGLNKSARSLRALGGRLSSVGSSLTAGVSLPLLGIAGASLKAAVSFESAFAGVRKTVDATETQFAALNTGIRNLATSTLPQSAVEIAGVAEAAGQLGVGADDILGFTETMAKLGTTTNLSAKDAATSIARFANITQTSFDQVGAVGDVIVDLGNKLATTEAELTEFGLRIAGAGKQIGLSNDEILAFGGALSSVGIKAEAGGTAISRVFVEINKAVNEGGENLEAFARVAGVSATQFADLFQRDASEAIVTFIEGLGRIQQSGGDTFAVLDRLSLNSVRVRDALLRSAGAGELLRNSLDIASTAAREGSATNTEFAERMKTTASQMALLRNQVVEVGIKLGDALLPALRAALSVAQVFTAALAEVSAAFSALPTPIQAVVVGFGVFAAAIGPVTFALGKLIKLGASFATLLTTGFGPIGAVVAGVTALATAFTFLSGSTEKTADSVNEFLTAAEQIDAALTKNKQSIKALAEELVEADEKLESTREKVAALEKTAANTGKSFRLEKARDEMAAAESAAASLRARIAELQVAGQQLQVDKAFERLSATLEQAQQKFDLTKNSLGETQAELERAITSAAAYEAALDAVIAAGNQDVVTTSILSQKLGEQRAIVDQLTQATAGLSEEQRKATQDTEKITALSDVIRELSDETRVATDKFGLLRGSMGENEAQADLLKTKISSLEQAIDAALVIGTEEAIATAADLASAWEAETAQLDALKLKMQEAADAQAELREEQEFQNEILPLLSEGQQSIIDGLNLSAQGTRQFAEELAFLREEQTLFLLDGILEWEAWKEQMNLILSDTSVQLALFAEQAVGAVKSISNNFGQALAQTLVFGKSFSKTFGNLMKQFAAQLIASFLSIIAQMIIFQAISLLTTKSATSGIITTKAFEGAASAYASVLTALPFPANIALAPIVATAQLAAILAFQGGFAALAEGGIVTDPTLALIGEGRESEAIIPLSQLDRFVGAGGTTINVLLDGDIITTAVLERMPDEVNLVTGI